MIKAKFSNWMYIVLILALGAVLRFYGIFKSEFFFFDEGLYLQSIPASWEIHHQNATIFSLFQSSLATDKPLWFGLVGLRLLWSPINVLFFPRILSAFFGTLTLLITYQLSKRLSGSHWAGILSALFLAVLPSHVFYSRLALPEATTIFFFLSALYLYLVSRVKVLQTLVSGALFACAYFCNYRLIILPVLLFFCEVFKSLSEHRKPDFKKYGLSLLSFFYFIIMASVISDGKNTSMTFSWIFHHLDLSDDHFELINIFSYPYYIFRLEGWLFGILFFESIVFIFKRQWKNIFPFTFVFLGMIIFSLADDKAVRYISAFMPFMAMAVSNVIVSLLEEGAVTNTPKKSKKAISQRSPDVIRKALVVFSILTIGTLFIKSIQIVNVHSDYEQSAKYIENLDPEARAITTQSKLVSLYWKEEKNLIGCPKQAQMDSFLKLKKQGFKYLILGPQTYISWTQNDIKFNKKLKGFLGFITKKGEPIKVFPHFNQIMLERFVFEHNENLRQSIYFLNSPDEHLGELRIYDLNQVFQTLKAVRSQMLEKEKTEKHWQEQGQGNQAA